MKIGEIREVINRAGYMRNDLSGHTRDEFLHRDVPAWLNPQIEALRALEILPRFRVDEERRQYEIDKCLAVIDRWRGLRITAGLRPEGSQPPATDGKDIGLTTVQERNVILRG